jgi:GTP-binding protein
MTTPMVAIVGRPNVGKSTLFNRLVGHRAAIVEDVPGVTRDRNYADSTHFGRTFTVIDTGGFIPEDEDPLLAQVREQAQLAIEECEVVLWVVDGRAGRTAADETLGTLLRKSGKPVLLIVNKVDGSGPNMAGLTAEFFSLGIEPVLDVSAEHNRGIEDLVDAILERLPPEEPAAEEPEPDENAPVRVAIVGRPNVGKSTLINALLKEDRVVASPVPGTTRDPVDSAFEHKGRRWILTDTAGIRRKSNISQRVEQYAVVAALKSIERSDVAVLVMDATEPAVDQDAKIAAVAEEKGRALVIVVNKWDQLERTPKLEKSLREELALKLKFVSYAPMVFTSALKGEKVDKVLELAHQVGREYRFRAPTPQLNRLLQHITEEHPLPFANGRPLRLYYMAQVSAAPPTFILTCNRPASIPDRYKRYIVNQLRETFGLRVPLRLLFRDRPGQDKRDARKKKKEPKNAATKKRRARYGR